MTAAVESHSIEAEESVLGAMLVSEAAIPPVVAEARLTTEDFYRGRHATIYAAIRDLYDRSQAVDTLTVTEHLKAQGKLDEAGGPNAINSLAANTPVPGNAVNYAEIVKRHALDRAKHRIGLELTNGLKPVEAIDRLQALTSSSGRGGGVATPLAAIQRERVEFIWRDRLPAGMLSLLMGDPGLGKSQLSVAIAAEITAAGGSVLMMSAEDHPAVTIRPRAEAAGANLDRLHIVSMTNEDGMEDSLSLPDDALELDRLVEETGATFVVIDPLMAHLPESVNSWRDQSMRRALGPLHRIASKRRVSFLIVVHLNKATGANTLYRAGGSIGIPAAVRSALLLARDPDDPDPERGTRRVVAHVKSNIGPQQETLAANIETIRLDDGTEAPCLKITGTSDASAADLLGGPVAEVRTKRDDAADFLREELADGPRPVKEIKDAAGEAGIGWRTIEDAKAELKVSARREGFGKEGGWKWSLPIDRTDIDRTPIISTPAAFEQTASESGIEDPTESIDRIDRKAAEITPRDADIGCAAHPAGPADGCRYCEGRG